MSEKSETRVLGDVARMVREVIAEDWADDVPIEMHTSFSKDLELESIEFVALAETHSLRIRQERQPRRLARHHGARTDSGAQRGATRGVHRPMRIATDDGLELHVEELGEGPPVIMLHGLLVGNMTTWYLDRGARAREEPPGHLVRPARARSQPARGERVRRRKDDERSRVARPSHDRRTGLDLVGHSYGAVVALTLRAASPEPGQEARPGGSSPSPFVAHRARRFSRTRGHDVMLDALPATAPHLRRRRRSAKAPASSTPCASSRRKARSSPICVPPKTCPTRRSARFAVRSSPSTASTSSCRPAGDRLARLVPGASLVELSGGHFLPLETPRLLTETLTRFIDG